jgi:hypothetical protein
MRYTIHCLVFIGLIIQYIFISQRPTDAWAASSCLDPERAEHVDCSGSGSQFAYVRTSGPDEQTAIIMETEDAKQKGDWIRGTMAKDKHGIDYFWSSTHPNGRKAGWWMPVFPDSGKWTVYLWWSQGENRCANTPVIIRAGERYFIKRVNQQKNGGTWNLLGTYHFPAGQRGGVAVSNKSEKGYVVIADAVKFEPAANDQ